MPMLTFAFCTYKRADRLERLITTIRAQQCPVPFEILAINNNSPDNTLEILGRLAKKPGPTLRIVTEIEQGIVHARNRAIAESLDSDILVFIDDDELPLPGLIESAYHAIVNEEAECVGGKVEMDFSDHTRPTWLGNELLGFLAAVDHGDAPFWIQDTSTPIWTANIAYDMRIFRDNPDLRFDKRYNRKGADIGGGEDAILFRTLLERKVRLRYSPGMVVLHAVEPWRLKRRYFLKLHYRAGIRHGRNQLPDYPQKLLGVPPFLFNQFMRQSIKTLGILVRGKSGHLRQAMNAAHALGTIIGYAKRDGATHHD